MAGLPLKSGADFYNLEAARLRLHNLGADPTEVGAGLIYFNTSTGLNTSQKARLYTGSAWKTIAFSEDLDVASNADFLALKERVDLLSGDVDTDAIISNMKEVSAFLEGFAEDASLMDYLNTELGKKLDLTGGTISGGVGSLKILRTNPYASSITFQNTKDGAVQNLGGLGFDNKGNASAFSADNSKTYTLLHSGNVGDYALKTDGSNNINANTGLKWSSSSISSDGYGSYFCVGVDYSATSELTKSKRQYNSILNVGGDASFAGYRFQLASYVGTQNELFYRGYDNGNSKWKDWKTIAFTDSNVESATKLQTARTIWGQSFDGTADVSGDLILNNQSAILSYTTSGTSLELFNISSNNNLSIGYSMAGVGGSYIYGNEIYLRYGSSRTTGLILNSSGNVTIGSQDLAGTGTKLYVDGDIGGVEHLTFVGGWMEIGLVRNSSNAVQDLIIQANGGKSLSINPNGGNVGIGTTNPQAKLEVAYSTGTSGIEITRVSSSDEASIAFNGKDGLRSVVGIWNNALNLWHNGAVGLSISKNLDVHIAGNLIVDGEVSAGGAGTEGGNAGGGGAFHSESIGVGATQTTIAHGLGTDDIVVSIYEKDGVSGRWSLILTDVEIVDANNIIVSFGSATSVEHKVVIMGAVA